MYRYLITTSDTEAYYDLSVSMLQGIYSYVLLSLEDRKYRNKLLDISIIAEDDALPLLSDSSPNDLYFQAIYNPLEYKLPEVEDPNLPVLIVDGYKDPGNIYAIALPSMSRREPNGFTSVSMLSIVTENMEEYLAGLFLIDMLVTKSKSVTSFSLYYTPYSQSLLVSAISEFPLLELPPEVLLIITDHYPCDWINVNKFLNELVQRNKYLDPRADPEGRMASIIYGLQRNKEPAIVYIKNRATQDELYELYNIISNRVNEEVVTNAILDRAISLVGVIKFMEDARSKIRLGAEPIRRILSQYSDQLYFAEAYMFRHAGSYKNHADQSYIALSFLNRLEAASYDDYNNLDLGRLSEDLAVEVLEDIMKNNGELLRTAVNPATGTRKEGFQEHVRFKYNIPKFINRIADDLNFFRTSPRYRFIRALYSVLNKVPDGPYMIKLSNILPSLSILADVEFVHTSISTVVGSQFLTGKELSDLESIITNGYRRYGFFRKMFEPLEVAIKSHLKYESNVEKE